MNEGRTYLDYIEDIRDAIEKVAEFIDDMTYEQFAADDKTAFAVIRAFEVLGEAAKSVPDSLRRQYDSIPWREMSQMRDKLIHHYYGVNLEVVWKTATEQLPKLSGQIDQVLSEMRDSE
jgi:uncharacterized protein with HEPN domain